MKDDGQLIAETLAGNTAAFGTLVQRYQDRLYHSLVVLIGCPHDAEDVAQDAFVHAFGKLSSFREESSFYTWLYRIAVNRWITARRRQHAAVSLADPALRPAARNTSDQEEPTVRLQRLEQIEKVRAAIGQLAEDFRCVVILRDIDGCDYQAIAQILDIPVGTVRSRLHRARLQLKEQLKEVLEVAD